MQLAESAVLGLVQGITEFLPVSSSGHLVVFQHLLGLGTVPLVFDTFVHAGTLLSIVLVTGKQVFSLYRRWWRELLLGILPVVAVGLLVEPHFEVFFKTLHVVAFGWLVSGLLLIATKWIRTSEQDLHWKVLFVIGIAQIFAIIPGISRSGVTIAAALLMGVSAPMAFAVSFALGLPVILGAALTQLVGSPSASWMTMPYLSGFLLAFISGSIALLVLKKVVVGRLLHWFGYYCLLASAGLIGFLVLN